jgi:hypothetical protein
MQQPEYIRNRNREAAEARRMRDESVFQASEAEADAPIAEWERQEEDSERE